jgi:hypothetical protein
LHALICNGINLLKVLNLVHFILRGLRDLELELGLLRLGISEGGNLIYLLLVLLNCWLDNHGLLLEVGDPKIVGLVFLNLLHEVPFLDIGDNFEFEVKYLRRLNNFALVEEA